MAKEIERKFLARVTSNLVADKRFTMQSGYISAEDPEVRVACYTRVPDSFQITVKKGSGLTREEIICNIADREGEQLLALTPHRVEKTRQWVGRWEIDTYIDRWFGLVVAEIELNSQDEPLPPVPPGLVLLKEITEDARFKNKAMATASDSDVQYMLREYRAHL